MVLGGPIGLWGTNFRFWGVNGLILVIFKMAVAAPILELGPKSHIMTISTPQGLAAYEKKKSSFCRPNTQYWTLLIFSGGGQITPRVGLFGQFFYVTKNYIYRKVVWAIDPGRVFRSHTLAPLTQFGPKT